tara:strand:- start:1172 stop:2356 length:1185 start_codon:yes stop_codon:yes gene_type:complete
MALKQLLKSLRNYFEPKKKNPVSIQNDRKLDDYFRGLKVGDIVSGLQLSKDDVKISGDLTAKNLTVDQIYNEKINSYDNFIITAAGDIQLNANGYDITFAVGGTNYLSWNVLTGLTFHPVAGAGTGTIFNNQGKLEIKTSSASAGNVYVDSARQISLDAGSGDVYFLNSGTPFAEVDMDTADTFKFRSETNYHLQFESSGTGDIVFDSGGDIVLDSHDGNFIAKKAGTEFSASNSAYAGMILGYTDIGLNEARASYSLTTSYVVQTDEHGVTFKAPPSGNVEIFTQIGRFHAGSSGFGDLYVGLSDANATSGYNSLGAHHEENILDNNGRNAMLTPSHTWTITGLTAGQSYTYYVGVKSSSVTGTPKIEYGGTGSGHYASFIMKATALPETIST